MVKKTIHFYIQRFDNIVVITVSLFQVPQAHIYLQPSSRPGGSGHGPGAASLYMKPHPQILMTTTLPPSPRPQPTPPSTAGQSASGAMKRPKYYFVKPIRSSKFRY